MLNTIEVYFLLFITYALLGWVLEGIEQIIQRKKLINRGFLIGPYCPIYGWGGLAITIILKKYLDDPLALFLFALLICAILEYFTSYVMEKVFKARWWDYSSKKFNINGRICLETIIPFGILGMIISYITNPFFFRIYESIDITVLHFITGILFVIFLIDNIISTKVISNVEIEGEKFARDNTEEITRKVKEVLLHKDWLTRRLIKAYPNLKDIQIRVKENIDKAKKGIKDNIEKTKEETKKQLREIKNKTEENVKKFRANTQVNIYIAKLKAQSRIRQIRKMTQENIKKMRAKK